MLRWSPDPSQRPVGPVTYTFSRLTSNTMLLLPPPQAPDSRPLFHISVETNCFRPASFLTVVRRGGSAQGPFVGEFEYAGDVSDYSCRADCVVGWDRSRRTTAWSSAT